MTTNKNVVKNKAPKKLSAKAMAHAKGGGINWGAMDPTVAWQTFWKDSEGSDAQQLQDTLNQMTAKKKK